MAAPKEYRTYAEFEREEIRPSFKVGFSMEDMVEEANFESDAFDWDKDPFEVEEKLPRDTDPERAGAEAWRLPGSTDSFAFRFCFACVRKLRFPG